MDPPEQALVEVGAPRRSPLRPPPLPASSPPRLQKTPSGPMPPPSNASTPRSRGRTSPTPACPSTLRACTPPGSRRPSSQWRSRPSSSAAGCWSARRKPIRKAGAPCCGRVEGDPGRRLSVNAIRRIIRSLGPVGSTGRRRSRPLRSRIKPEGVDHTTIFPAEGG